MSRDYSLALDRNLAFSAYERGVELVDLATGDRLGSLKRAGAEGPYCKAVAASSKGELVVASYGDDSLAAWKRLAL